MKVSRKDIFQWDVHNWSKSLSVWNVPSVESHSKRSLTLGEREGGLSLYFSSLGYDVTCTDLECPPPQIQEEHQQYELTGSISYSAADVLSLPFEDDSFDVIAFKSVIGALSTRQNQGQALNEMYRVLKPGGILCFAENLSGGGIHRFLRKRFVKWSHYWRYLELPSDMELLSKFKEVEFETRGYFGTFGRSEFQRKLLGYVDSVIEKIVPRRKRYIFIVRAKK